jgi:pilus assembly protein CpaC
MNRTGQYAGSVGTGWVLLLMALVLFSVAPGARAEAPSQVITMTAHDQRVMRLSGPPARVAVADPKVADIQIMSAGSRAVDQILLIANAPGTTDVRAWVSGNPTPVRWRVRVVSGVRHALESRGGKLQNNVDVDGGKAVVTGQASSLLQHQRSVAAADAAAGAGKSIDLSTISTSGVVQVSVKVVEVTSSVLKDAGIQLGASGSHWSAGLDILPQNLTGGFSLAYNATHFNASLQLLEQNGLARVLAEPTLVALSGQSASFLAGGEIPVPEAGGLGTQSVTYKPYGIGLTVSPTVLSPDRIALKVAPEASELDYNNAVSVTSGGQTTVIPALRTRRADTTVELGDGESFIISGLVSHETIANVSKVPFLGDLPIIGAFFRSIQYSQNDKELVIVVTPHLVRPFAKGAPVPLPGERQAVADTPTNAWGYYLLGPAGGQQMPGFSR